MPESTRSHSTLKLPSTLETVDRIEQEAVQLAERSGFDEDDRTNISMAVREAAVNAVLHGNQYSPEKQVVADFEVTDDALTVRVADQGSGFDPESIPDPLSPENILRGSGRGVFLMRAFMDTVNFRQLSPGTEITLVKLRPGAGTQQV